MQGSRCGGCVQSDLFEALYAKRYVQGHLCKTLNAGCYVRGQELCIRYLGTDAVGCYVESVVCRVLDTGAVYSVLCCAAPYIRCIQCIFYFEEFIGRESCCV